MQSVMHSPFGHVFEVWNRPNRLTFQQPFIPVVILGIARLL